MVFVGYSGVTSFDDVFGCIGLWNSLACNHTINNSYENYERYENILISIIFIDV